jgi:signal transduction histidine kinase
MEFGRLGRREIESNFRGSAISFDGGLMLVRQLDRKIGLSKAAAAVLNDPRDQQRITHSLHDLLAQRLYGLYCRYEDINDHDRLRHDPLLQTAVGKMAELASSPSWRRA